MIDTINTGKKFIGFFLGFVILCQATTLTFPGKEPMMFYFCQGKMPKSLIGVKPKSNASFNFTILIAMIVHLLSYIHIKYRKRKKVNDQEIASSGERRSDGKDQIYR